MSTTTDELSLPYPDLDGSDPADVPQDLKDLVDRLELILTAGHDSLWNTGDFKVSARTTNHGRWLLCDGAQYTQAEIESALGLDTGDGADLVAVLGTGSGSLYGSASTGKVRLPDPRGRALVGVGAGSGLTARAIGATGGAETVTLSAAEAPLKAHSHSVSDSGHVHTASQAAHSHSVTDPGHSHGKTDPGHVHTASQAAHSHSTAGLSIGEAGSHEHQYGGNVAGNTRTDSGTGSRITALADGVGGEVDRYTTGVADHTHTLDGSLANATPTITVASATTGITILDATTGISLGNATPAVTVASATTGVSVVAASGEAAASGHNNMPPWIGLGHAFIRV